MISLIQGSDAANFPHIMKQVFELRAKVFHERLKWDVKVIDGQERDEFDEIDPLYIVSHTTEGKVRGTLRLLPTTGPNMLADVFNCLLPEGENVASPLIWESSRFAVDHTAFAERSENCINQTTAELLCAMNEVGMIVGLEFVMSVVDVHMERVLKKAGCPCDRLGKPQKIGKVTTVAGLWEIGDALQQSLMAASSISENVLQLQETDKLSLVS